MRIISQVIFIHPLRHHLYPAIVAVQEAGISVKYVTMQYYKGPFADQLSHSKYAIIRKISGFFDAAIKRENVHSPVTWQLKRIFGRKSLEALIVDFDKWCAQKISGGEWAAQYYHIVQDYLPETCKAIAAVNGQLVCDMVLANGPSVDRDLTKIYAETPLRDGYQPFFPDTCGEAELSARSGRILVPSELVASGVRSVFSDVWKVTKIRYGTDISGFNDLRLRWRSTDRLRILVRANSVRKGGHIFLLALGAHSQAILALSGGKEIEFVLLGSVTRDLAPLLEDVAAMLPENVRVTQRSVAHAAMNSFYNEFDFFVMPSLLEGMSLAAVEAAASGLPLLLSKRCGVDDFKDGKHGYLINDLTVAGLAEGICRMIEAREKWGEFSAEARLLAESLSIERYRREIAVFYQELVNG